MEFGCPAEKHQKPCELLDGCDQLQDTCELYHASLRQEIAQYMEGTHPTQIKRNEERCAKCFKVPETGELMAKTIAQWLNRKPTDEKGFMKTMRNTHNTLQQFFTGLCLSWLCEVSQFSESEVDRRNEASFEIAKKIDALVDLKTAKRLPLI